MKAAVCREFGGPLLIEEIDIAGPGKEDVAVDIHACAICHSDILAMEGAWGGHLPVVFGHEASGVVTKIGADVDHIAVGDHVVVTLIRSCGNCHYCDQNEPVHCESSFEIGEKSPLTEPNGEWIKQGIETGAFAEKAVVHGSQVVKIDKDIPMDVASLLACGVITGFGAVANTAELKSGQSAVIVGAGGVGLNSIQAAKVLGANPIIAVDVSDEKLASSLDFGATNGINPMKEDLAEGVKTLTEGRGADHVFITVGNTKVAEAAFNYLSKKGKMTLVGMPASGEMISFEHVNSAFYGHQIVGSRMGSARILVDIPYLVSLYRSGELKLDELVSNKFNLDQINEAVAESKSGSSLRNVVMMR